MKIRLILLLCAMAMACSFAASVKPAKQKNNGRVVKGQPSQTRNADNAYDRLQAGKGGFRTVKATGKGESLELAREDAKRNALAQVVGEAIKARTDIKENGDDATVISKFLAASAGFISKFEEIDTSSADGIFTVTANVTVYSEKLLESVTFGDDSSELIKEVQQARVGSDVEETREKMTKYICSYMLDYCRIWGVTAKELIPGYDNGGQPVLRVNCYFGTSPDKYQMYMKRLNTAMARIGAKPGVYKHELTKSHTPVQYVVRPDNQANATNHNGGNPGKGWTHLWLPSKFLEEPQSFEHEIAKYGYRVTIRLLDEQDEVIATKEIGVSNYGYNDLPFPHVRYGLKLLPLNDKNKTCYRRKCHVTFDGFASADEMLKVKRVAVFVEPVKKSSAPTVDFKQYFDKEMKWGWYEK